MRAAGQALAQAVRARRGFLAAPRKIYLKEFLLAVALADRLADAGDVRHLHAHFAHGTTTVTWLRLDDHRDPVLLHRPREGHLHRGAEPAGLLRASWTRRRFVVTCTEANRTPPGVARLPDARCTSSTTASTPTSSPGRGGHAPVEPPASACSRSGRLVRKKGFDTSSSTRARCCAAAACRLRGRDRRRVRRPRGGGARPGGSARSRTRRTRVLGPLTQAELFAEYQRASVFCLPCRVLEDGDRDGIPNVLVEAMACGLPGGHHGRLGHPELVRDGVNGLLVAPDRPSDLADALHRLSSDPELAARLAERPAATTRERFDGDRAPRMASLLFARRRSR